MGEEIDFETPELFSVDAEGPVGERVFLLYVKGAPGALTLKAEKSQVAVLGTYLARIVRELGQPGDLATDLDFDTTDEPDWIVGSIGVSYDEESRRVLLILEEAVEETAENGEDGTVARVALTPEQAAAFAIRAVRLVAAGRPTCPLCGLPLDDEEHVCPRTNGHRPTTS